MEFLFSQENSRWEIGHTINCETLVYIMLLEVIDTSVCLV